jgi:hypothetical protein
MGKGQIYFGATNSTSDSAKSFEIVLLVCIILTTFVSFFITFVLCQRS